MGKAAKHDRSRQDLDLPPLAAWSLGRTGADITVTIGCLSFHPVQDSYCVDEFHDSFHWKAACGADSVNIVIKRH